MARMLQRRGKFSSEILAVPLGLSKELERRHESEFRITF